MNKQIAFEIFSLIQPCISFQGESDDFSSGKYKPSEACAFGITIENNILTEHTLLKTSSDVYHLLDILEQDATTLIWDCIAITSQGWASPNDSFEGTPSEHPDRVRAFMVSIVDNEQNIYSVVKLDDEDQELNYDTSASGNLADALKNLYPKEKQINDSNKFYI